MYCSFFFCGLSDFFSHHHTKVMLFSLQPKKVGVCEQKSSKQKNATSDRAILDRTGDGSLTKSLVILSGKKKPQTTPESRSIQTFWKPPPKSESFRSAGVGGGRDLLALHKNRGSSFFLDGWKADKVTSHKCYMMSLVCFVHGKPDKLCLPSLRLVWRDLHCWTEQHPTVKAHQNKPLT